MAGPKPQLVALLMCDSAFQQAGTGTWCIIGVFDAVNAPQLPFTMPTFSAFIALSDFVGDAMVQLVIRDEEGGVVKAVRSKIPRIPLGLFQSVFPFLEVEFKTAGVHTLEFFAGDELITLRSFRVQSMAADPEQDRAEAMAADQRHREQVVRDAMQVWASHPDAQPVGLIAAASATQAPWFRSAFSAVFGGTPPQADFVGIVDPDTAERLLNQNGDPQAVRKVLAEAFDRPERILPIALVTRGGFMFAMQVIDE